LPSAQSFREITASVNCNMDALARFLRRPKHSQRGVAIRTIPRERYRYRKKDKNISRASQVAESSAEAARRPDRKIFSREFPLHSARAHAPHAIKRENAVIRLHARRARAYARVRLHFFPSSQSTQGPLTFALNTLPRKRECASVGCSLQDVPDCDQPATIVGASIVEQHSVISSLSLSAFRRRSLAVAAALRL